MRLGAGLPSLRKQRTLKVVLRVLGAVRARVGLRIAHFSVQTNHLHLIVETRDEPALGRGMQGLGVRLARALNRAWGRRGSVLGDRYHARALKTPREVRAALVYVLANARKHGIGYGKLDPFASGRWFDGWREAAATVGRWIAPVGAARTWLLAVGWRRYGRIGMLEAPRSG
jgi:REP element-mobilizing transposase RayT